jgi:hypothetical protein
MLILPRQARDKHKESTQKKSGCVFLQDKNPALKIVFKALKCCMWCAENVVKYLTNNAYICVAITGQAFIPSAWQAFKILMSNTARCGIVQGISWIVLWLGKICITAGATFSLYYVLNNDPAYLPPTVCTHHADGTIAENGQCGGEYEISDPRLPCLCTAIMSFIVASAFMNAFGVTTNTLLFSLCYDEILRDENHKSGDKKYVLYAERQESGLLEFAKSVDNGDTAWCPCAAKGKGAKGGKGGEGEAAPPADSPADSAKEESKP